MGYNGSIELISGITPKNGGTFPLVNSKDVLMPDGSRLSDFATPVTDLKYFSITNDGVISLRPEYRAAFSVDSSTLNGIQPEDIFSDNGYEEKDVTEDGTTYHMLYGREGSSHIEFPKLLIIPDVINGISVTELSPYMFANNQHIEEVRLPTGITSIPYKCFINAKNLRVVLGTTDVTEIGFAAFGSTSITSLEFPNLTVMGEQAFAGMKDLRTIDIGNVTEIPMAAFYVCRSLYSVSGGKSVTKIGNVAFYSTYNLQHLDCIFYQTEEANPQNTNSTITRDHWNSNLGEKSIGGGAFIASAFDDFGDDDDGIPSSAFADYSISYAQTPPESFKNYRHYIKQQENPAPAIIEQSDSKWRDYIFYGDDSDPKHYHSGCRFISFIHAYAGLYGLQLHSPDEFEGILRELETRKGKTLIEYTAKSPTTWYKDIADFFDLQYECLDGTMTEEEKLRKFYTAFAEGKYAIIGHPSKVSAFLDSSNTNPVPSSGHVVMVHGIREDGRVCIVDSANPDRNDSLTVLTQTGAIPLRALIREDSKIHLYSKRDDAYDKFFNITTDGVISLKPEFRGPYAVMSDTVSGKNLSDIFSDNGYLDRGDGAYYGYAGSKYSELPEKLVIPDYINNIKVTKLAEFMFAGNERIVEIKLPIAVTTIPGWAFTRTINLKSVYNHAQVTAIGESAFQLSRIEKMELPNVETLGKLSFCSCFKLANINIGEKVSEIPDKCFMDCRTLYSVSGGTNVTKIGYSAFASTHNLHRVEFITDKLKEVASGAFIASSFDNWPEGNSISFGPYCLTAHPTNKDFWSDKNNEIVQVENPVPTVFPQLSDNWKNNPILGDNESNPPLGLLNYNNGCLFVSFVHAYCGLYNLSLQNMDEFETIAKSVTEKLGTTIPEYYPASDHRWVKSMAEALGLTVEAYHTATPSINPISRLYKALAEGKYAIVTYPSALYKLEDEDTSNDYGAISGHAVMIYGVRSDGKLCVLDSAGNMCKGDPTVHRFAIPGKSFIDAINGTEYIEIDILGRPDSGTSVYPYVTPQLYGAMADGVHDDTMAIQSALNSGKPVKIPAGQYLVTSKLFTKPYTNISGDGNSTIIRCNSSEDLFMIAYGVNISDIRIQVITDESNKMGGSIFKMNEESLADSVPYHCNNVRSSIRNILMEANGDAHTSGHLSCFETSLTAPWGPDNNKRLGIYGLTVDNINVSFSVSAGLGYFYRSYVGSYVDEASGKPLWITGTQFSNCGMIGPRWCFFMGHQDDNMFEYKGECELTAYNVYHQKTDENCIGFLFQRANTRVSLFGCTPWDWAQHGDISTHCPYVIDTGLCKDASTYWLDNSRGRIQHYRMVSNGDDRCGGTPLTYSDYGTYYSFLKKPFLPQFLQRPQALVDSSDKKVALIASIKMPTRVGPGRTVTFEYQYLQKKINCSIYIERIVKDDNYAVTDNHVKMYVDDMIPTYDNGGTAEPVATFHYTITGSGASKVCNIYVKSYEAYNARASVVKSDCFTNSIAHFSGDQISYPDYLFTINGLDYSGDIYSSLLPDDATELQPVLQHRVAVIQDDTGKRWQITVSADGTLGTIALDGQSTT